MKKILVLCLLLFGSIISAAHDDCVVMPCAQVLRERILTQGLDNFLEKTKLDQFLADKTLHPRRVTMAVNLALYKYNKALEHPLSARTMQTAKSNLIKTILQDSPAAIEVLARAGVLA